MQFAENSENIPPEPASIDCSASVPNDPHLQHPKSYSLTKKVSPQQRNVITEDLGVTTSGLQPFDSTSSSTQVRISSDAFVPLLQRHQQTQQCQTWQAFVMVVSNATRPPNQPK